MPANSGSSIHSSLSSLRDQSSENDTPATSIAVTPAESSIKGDSVGRRSAHLHKNYYSGMNYETSVKGKRKRAEEDELMEADARLARALQETEYEDLPAHSSVARRKRGRVQDSEDDEPFSSSAPMTSSTPAVSRSEKSKTPGVTLLPSRAARASANKSLKNSNVQRIFDSEDSDASDLLSDVSLFATDMGSDALEASGDSDEDASEVAELSDNAASAAGGMVAPPPAPASRMSAARRRRMAPVTQTANANRNRRHWRRGIEDRVGQGFALTYSTVNSDI